jgi:hypothetical protein
MQQHLAQLENRLWDAADELRANSGLKPSEYGTPVLGLIFLRFAETRFEAAGERIEVKASARRRIGATDFQAEGILYAPEAARFQPPARPTETTRPSSDSAPSCAPCSMIRRIGPWHVASPTRSLPCRRHPRRWH